LRLRVRLQPRTDPKVYRPDRRTVATLLIVSLALLAWSAKILADASLCALGVLPSSDIDLLMVFTCCFFVLVAGLLGVEGP
jgi:hypothetical protein